LSESLRPQSSLSVLCEFCSTSLQLFLFLNHPPPFINHRPILTKSRYPVSPFHRAFFSPSLPPDSLSDFSFFLFQFLVQCDSTCKPPVDTSFPPFLENWPVSPDSRRECDYSLFFTYFHSSFPLIPLLSHGIQNTPPCPSFDCPPPDPTYLL